MTVSMSSIRTCNNIRAIFPKENLLQVVVVVGGLVRTLRKLMC